MPASNSVTSRLTPRLRLHESLEPDTNAGRVWELLSSVNSPGAIAEMYESAAGAYAVHAVSKFALHLPWPSEGTFARLREAEAARDECLARYNGKFDER